ncbi:alpha/beta fold hydrolase [Flavobacterium sp.]|uniref:alpha/beta fold hydrolase n=1 Tax=Flavobacterium sp. TaxID=239 RepID=UPI0037529BD7
MNSNAQMRCFLQKETTNTSAIPYGNNAKAGHYVTVDNTKIYYEIYGKGEPFVLLHGGINGSTYEMKSFIDSLSKKYQVIAISTRGHGKSEIGTIDHTYKQKANDALAVINKVTKDSVIVLGFSDGGYTGYQLASLFPQKVKKMIIIGAAQHSLGTPKINFNVAQAMQMDSLYWKQQLSIMPEPKRLQEMFDKVIDEYNNHLVVDKNVLETIKCPVLLMAGDHDFYVTIDNISNAYKMIPKAQLSIIPNSGHTAFIQKFDVVWTAVNSFLNE